MKIINVRALRNFWKKHSDSEQKLKAWNMYTKEANWKIPQNIKNDFPSASFISGSDNRVIFNIKGNTYRLIVKINYPQKIIKILGIYTHEEYNKIDVNKI